jgi:hypothetical protein
MVLIVKNLLSKNRTLPPRELAMQSFGFDFHRMGRAANPAAEYSYYICFWDTMFLDVYQRESCSLCLFT